MTTTLTAAAVSAICTITVTDPTNGRRARTINIAQTSVPALAPATVTFTQARPL